MLNSPLLLNYLCLGARVDHRRVYSHILAKVCAAAMAIGLVKNKAEKMVFVYSKKNPIKFSSLFAHYELPLNSFCQHCANQILT